MNELYFQIFNVMGDLLALPHNNKDTRHMVHSINDLRRMPDNDLDEHIRLATDRWTWDSGKDTDRRTLELLEKERQTRRDEGFRVERVKTSNGHSSIRIVPIE